MTDVRDEMRKLLNVITESFGYNQPVAVELEGTEELSERGMGDDFYTADTAANLSRAEAKHPALAQRMKNIINAIGGLEIDVETKREMVRVLSHLASYVGEGEGSNPQAELTDSANYGMQQAGFDTSDPMQKKIVAAIKKVAAAADVFVSGDADDDLM